MTNDTDDSKRNDQPASLVSKDPQVCEAERQARTLIHAIKTGTANTELASLVSTGANTTYKELDAVVSVCRVQQQSRKDGGRSRGQQQYEAAKEAAKPILEMYEEVRAQGGPEHKAISATTILAQQTPRHAGIDKRQVRRYRDKYGKKDSS